MTDQPDQPARPDQPPPAEGWWLASDGRWYPPESLPASGGQWSRPARSTNGLAIASLVLSLLWCYWAGSVVAIIFGHVALAQIKRSEGRQEGRGLAIAGIVIGWVAMALAVVAAILAVLYWEELSTLESDPVDGICNTDRMWEDPDC